MCKGETPPDLNVQSSIRVRKLFRTLIQTLNQLGEDADTRYLQYYTGPHTKYPSSGSSSDSSSGHTISQLCSVPGLNPLQLSQEMFNSKTIPQLDDIVNITSEQVIREGIVPEQDLQFSDMRPGDNVDQISD